MDIVVVGQSNPEICFDPNFQIPVRTTSTRPPTTDPMFLRKVRHGQLQMLLTEGRRIFRQAELRFVSGVG